MSGALDYAAAARALRSARREGRTLDVLLSGSPGLSLADAYRVQDGHRISASFGHARWSAEVRRPG